MFKIKKRLFIGLIGMTTLFVLLAVRLFWIQSTAGRPAAASGGRSMLQMSVVQRERGIVLDSGRGHFYDRRGLPITGNIKPVLVLFPLRAEARGEPEAVGALSAVLRTSPEELKRRWDALKAPYIWQAADGKDPLALSQDEIEAIGRLPLNGIRVLPYQTRYPNDFPAKQWLGFVAQNPDRLRREYALGLDPHHMPISTSVGAAGLERTFDDFLRGVGSTTVTYFVDAAKRPMFGLDTRMTAPDNPYYPLQIVTTIDLRLQNEIEAYADRVGMREGAIVVQDARNGDVAAMVSRPAFDPRHIDLNEGNWSNRALKAMVPGSIFKTVMAAAALETGAASERERFECRGEYGKYGFSCWKKEGHGVLTLQEAYAHSCNIAFGALGERLAPQQIERYASMLGLGRQIGWEANRFMDRAPFRQWDAEESGRIFLPVWARMAPGKTRRPGPEDGGVRVQTAVGQRDTLVTPLQASNLIVTLLHRGQVPAPRIVKEIRYANGQLMAEFAPHRSPSPYGAIRPQTADRLLRWMNDVVRSGTGKSLRNAKWSVAGKSGTAQVREHGAPRNNHWFIGYGPTEAPRYSAAVVVQNQPEGIANQAAIVFRGVMDIAARYTES